MSPASRLQFAASADERCEALGQSVEQIYSARGMGVSGSLGSGFESMCPREQQEYLEYPECAEEYSEDF